MDLEFVAVVGVVMAGMVGIVGMVVAFLVVPPSVGADPPQMSYHISPPALIAVAVREVIYLNCESCE